MDEHDHGQTPCNWEQNERLLARTFDSWRAEFRAILEDHRREIQARLEKIEREIEKKSDKENVDLVVRNIQGDLRRHSDDIKNLQTGLNQKMGVETMWKVVGLVLAISGAVGGVVGFLIRVLTGK
jgi:uncharacterized protein (DUF885 family)